MDVAVLGSGSWGTALAVLLARKGNRVNLWGVAEEIEAIRRDRENARYLPGIKLSPGIHPTSNLDEALSRVDAVVLAVPSTGVREVARRMKNLLDPQSLLINAGKGLESDTGLRGSQVIAQELGDEIGRRCVVLSGPNLAVELAGGVPTATVVASLDDERARRAQELFWATNLRVYTNSDVVGVELGGALKNVLAIGAGISDGLGYGDNTKATLVTRGVVEMIRLGTALGADSRTFTGLSGFGDLMATCASKLSRNLRLGMMLGQGKTLSESLEVLGQVAEGIYTCRAAYLLSKKHNVYMPITSEVYAVLFEGKTPQQAVADLMSRDHKEEF
ncbi:MAG: NAD(P)H-dependent glycerol-3-phosphate dehydrogenase [Armatimonadota bacterium]